MGDVSCDEENSMKARENVPKATADVATEIQATIDEKQQIPPASEMTSAKCPIQCAIYSY